MGVTPERLAAHYPRLYHMADLNSWESISKYGLLSTSSLMDLFEVNSSDRARIEVRKRDKSEEISHPLHGRAVIRDQSPIVESKLASSLRDCTPPQWYQALNGRVFFWLDTDRLATMLSARNYRDKPHLVLTLDTLSLVKEHEAAITLSPMNSGNTLPIAHPRGLDTFKTLNEYPFEERVRRGPYYTVVELAVYDGVRNIIDHIFSVDEMLADANGRVTALKNRYIRTSKLG